MIGLEACIVVVSIVLFALMDYYVKGCEKI